MEISQVTYQKLVVITTEMLAKFLDVDANNIKNNFNNNKNFFTEGKHYFYLEGENLKKFKEELQKKRNSIDLDAEKEAIYVNGIDLDSPKKGIYVNENLNFSISKKAFHLYLWTEKGAFHHLKLVNNESAFVGYEKLIDEYFRLKSYSEILSVHYEIAELQQQKRAINQQIRTKMRSLESLLPKPSPIVDGGKDLDMELQLPLFFNYKN